MTSRLPPFFSSFITPLLLASSSFFPVLAIGALFIRLFLCSSAALFSSFFFPCSGRVRRWLDAQGLEIFRPIISNAAHVVEMVPD